MDLIKKGNNALRDKKYEKAVSIYEKAIVENPNLKKIVSYNLNYAKNKCSLKNSFSNDFHSFLDFKINQKPSRLFKEFNNSEESKLIDIIECDSHFNNAISNVKVSVIMPTFNRIKTIKKAIDSVLNQSHSRLELLVIDDGSTDGTYEFIKKKYKDSRVLLIKGDHKGVSSARNLGIKKSTGEYIFYLDSDNYWRSDFLKLMIAGFLSSGAKVGYSAIKVEDESGKLLGYRGESFNWNECCKSNYVDLNPFGHSRDMIDQFGSFDEKLRRMVDWDMILRFTKNNQPFYIPYIGTIYTETSDDFNRISVKEPYAYKKIVQAKNNFSSNYVEKVKLNFAIKIPAPYEKRLQWGDFHFAESLKNSLEKLGHNVVLDYFGKWYERPTNSEDVVIVIRGLTEYEPRPGNINIMWNISHPDQVSYSEYDKYDIVYVASDSYSEFLNLF